MTKNAKVIASVLFVAWALFAVLFVAKLHTAIGHPNRNPGGLLFLVSQAALGAAVIMIWTLRKETA